jgi:hypothetical protein
MRLLVPRKPGTISLVFEVFVHAVVAASTPAVVVAVRVHAGTIRIGDRVTRAADAEGKSWPLNLEVRELALNVTPAAEGRSGPLNLEGHELALNEHTPTDSLGTNYGGLATLFGDYSPVRAGRTLFGESS